jgi:hypothetical protein
MKRTVSPRVTFLLVGVVACSVLIVGVAKAQVATPGAGSSSQQMAPSPGTDSTLVLLPLRAYQQTTSYTCGPATLLTLLRYYHRNGAEMRIAEEAKCSKEKGTNPQNMVAWLESHGFNVKWGEHGSLEMLRKNLAAGIPTIIEWIDWGGHWVTVVGYDTRGTETTRDDVIYFADPADGVDGDRDGLTSFSARRFNAMWFDAFLFDRPMFKVYITAVPKRTGGTN